MVTRRPIWATTLCLILSCAVTGCQETRESSESPSTVSAPNDTRSELAEGQWELPTASLKGAVVESAPPDMTNSIGMRFRQISPGQFLMGHASRFFPNAQPQHVVTITQPFYVGMFEVTQAEYARVVGSSPSYFQGPQNPVEQVSWEEAVEFCRRLSTRPEEQAAGRAYRLPTEAEWEYACRAGSTTDFHFGDDKERLGQYAWFDENSGSTTHPAGEKRPNAWGLYDMPGNVWEWCQDWFAAYPDSADAVVDPQGPLAGSQRVLRGGDWGFTAWFCFSSLRFGVEPSNRSFIMGFRVVAVPRLDSATSSFCGAETSLLTSRRSSQPLSGTVRMPWARESQVSRPVGRPN